MIYSLTKVLQCFYYIVLMCIMPFSVVVTFYEFKSCPDVCATRLRCYMQLIFLVIKNSSVEMCDNFIRSGEGYQES